MFHTVPHHVISPPKGHANEITPNTVEYCIARLFVESDWNELRKCLDSKKIERKDKGRKRTREEKMITVFIEPKTN